MKMVCVDLELDAPGTPQEAVIQIGAVQLDCRSGVIDAPFCAHLQIEKPIDEFIVGLTGITQEYHDRCAVPADIALASWWAYLGGKSVAAWGKDYWELIQLSKRLGLPHRMVRNTDLKSVGEVLRCALPGNLGKRGGLRPTMEAFGLEFRGRPHEAVVDAYNTARLAWRWRDLVGAALEAERRVVRGPDTSADKTGRAW